MYNDPNCKPWTSRSWAPEGFDSRAHMLDQQGKAGGVEEGREEKVGYEAEHKEGFNKA